MFKGMNKAVGIGKVNKDDKRKVMTGGNERKNTDHLDAVRYAQEAKQNITK